MSDDDQAAATQSAGSTFARRRWPLIAVGGTLLLVLAAVGAWASHQGYIVITSVACSDEGYRGPVPSFEQLVIEDGLNPYCARRVRGESLVVNEARGSSGLHEPERTHLPRYGPP